jgi:asparagine synthase (glutamine-hydrolysing)
VSEPGRETGDPEIVLGLLTSMFKGESIDYVRRVLYRKRARIWEVLDRKAVLGLVDDHLEGPEKRRLLIWSLLHRENWFAAFLG